MKSKLIFGLSVFIIMTLSFLLTVKEKQDTGTLTILELKSKIAHAESGAYPGTCSGTNCSNINYAEESTDYCCCCAYRATQGCKKSS